MVVYITWCESMIVLEVGVEPIYLAMVAVVVAYTGGLALHGSSLFLLGPSAYQVT